MASRTNIRSAKLQPVRRIHCTLAHAASGVSATRIHQTAAKASAQAAVAASVSRVPSSRFAAASVVACKRKRPGEANPADSRASGLAEKAAGAAQAAEASSKRGPSKVRTTRPGLAEGETDAGSATPDTPVGTTPLIDEEAEAEARPMQSTLASEPALITRALAHRSRRRTARGSASFSWQRSWRARQRTARGGKRSSSC